MEKNNGKNFFNSKMSRLGKMKGAKAEFYGIKKPVKVWDINFDHNNYLKINRNKE